MTRPRHDAALIGLALVVVVSILIGAWFLGRGGAVELPPAGVTDEDPTVVSNVVQTHLPQTPAAGGEGSDDTHSKRTEGPVLGVVLDARTRLPVPEIDVLLRGEELELRWVTDDLGEFRGTQDLEFSSAEIELRDLGVPVQATVVTKPGAPCEILAAVGPTYPIRFLSREALPVEGWMARLLEVRPFSSVSRVIEVREEGLRMPGRGEARSVEPESEEERADGQEAREPEIPSERAWPWTPVRGGQAGTWVRFPRVQFEPSVLHIPRLHVRHPRPGRVGRVTVVGTVGRQLAPPIPVGPTFIDGDCQVTGTVELLRMGSRGSSAREVRVVLLPSELELTDPDRPPVFGEQGVRAGGTYLFRHVPIGRRALVAYAQGHRSELRTVDLQVGQNEVPPIALPLTGESSLQVEFEVRDSLDSWEDAYASVLRVEGTGVFSRAFLLFDRGSRRSGYGTLRSWSLPDAMLVSHGVGVNSAPLWKPQGARWSPGIAIIDLQLAPAGDFVAHGLEVVVGDGTLPPGAYQVHFGPRGSLFGTYLAKDTRRWRLQRGSSLRYSVWAPGFAAVSGTQADFRDLGEERVARVRLERGWGAVLHFRAGDPETFAEDPGPWSRWDADLEFPEDSGLVGALAAPPVPRVGVSVDGLSLGRSDEEGRITLALRERPERLLLDAPGWRPVAVERVKFGRKEDDVRFDCIVWMERAAPAFDR